MTTAEVLRAAAARVRQGWCQGEMSNGSGVCAMGAVEVAVRYDLMAAYDVSCFAADALKLLPGESLHALAVWNDAKGQTAENVAAGLEYAALLCEQRQAQLARSSDVRQLQEA